MSTYATTATIHGTPIVRPRPGRHGNVHEPDLVEVARNRLQTDAPDVVRVTVTTSTDVEASAYLTTTAAEALADAILIAADLNPDQPQEPPTLAGGIGADTIRGGARTQERALRVLERAVADAVAAGCLRSETLTRVANGLLGEVNGPRSYALGRAFGDALEVEEARP